MSRRWYRFIGVIALLWTVRAEAATVMIVHPASASPAMTETVSRLRGELLSLGVQVLVAERPAGPAAGAVDPRAWLAPDAGGPAPDAVIDVVGDPAPAAVDIWIVERESRRGEVSRDALTPTGDGDPGQLAIRTVEVLRSSLLAIELASRGQGAAPAAPQPAAVADSEGRIDASQARQFDLEAGATMLASLDGVGPSLMPIVRVGWAPRPWFMLQATLAGLGSRPEVATATASARVAQQYAMLGGCVCSSSPQRIGLHLALAAGVLRTAIDGQADPPSSGHFVERWSFVLDGSVGARLRLPGRYHLTMAAHLQVAEPYVAIYFMDSRVATTGRPNLLVSLTVGAWL